MKYLYPLLLCLALILTGACSGGAETESGKYPTATGDGALRAHLDALDEQVAKVRNNRDQHRVHRFNMKEDHHISTAYAYWDYLEIYYNEEGLQSAVLAGPPEKGNRLEEFFFDDEGELIFGRFRPAADSNQVSTQFSEMYFIKHKLVKVRNEKGEQLSVENDSLKSQAIKMVKEAEEIRKLMASKNLKP